MAIATVTIKGHAFKVGDMCVLQDSRSAFGVLQPPATMTVHRIARLCGGESRQWVKLDDGQEFAPDGYRRGSSWSARGPQLLPYDPVAVENNNRDLRDYTARRNLSLKVDRVRWENVILHDDLAAKLREIVDAAEARGLMRP